MKLHGRTLCAARGLRLAALIGAILVVPSPGWTQAQAPPGWVPPGLSEEERKEWKEGRPPGWGPGVKRGWRGKGCPPGLAKKGGCYPRQIAGAGPAEQRKWEDQVRDAIERLRKWGRDKKKLPAATLDAALLGFSAALRHGVPIAIAERVVRAALERDVSAYGIEAITRALAYGAARDAPLERLESFTQQGLMQRVAADAIALGIYRLAAETKR